MAHLKDLLVAGPSRFIGEVAFNDSVTLKETLILAKNPQDAEAGGTSEGYPALIIGDNGNAGTHLAIDGNEIMAKTSTTAVGPLYLNNNGGLVNVGSGGLTVSGIINATQGSEASSTTSGALRVTGGLSTTAASWIGGGLLTIKSSSDNASSAITLWRGSNASWKIENASGTLHFNCNYTTSAQSTYTSLFSIAYNTGIVQTKGTIYLSNGTTYYISGSGSSKLTNLSLAGTLGVTGATTLSSTLGVTGVATFANTVKITKNAASSSTTTGSLQITGGIGATGQVNAQSFRIDNAAKFVYNSTDKCVDVIFG